jgi:hypothetical protein
LIFRKEKEAAAVRVYAPGGERHYGLKVGDIVHEKAFGCTVGPGEVIGFSPTDNNRVYIRLEDGEEVSAIAEYCQRVPP